MKHLALCFVASGLLACGSSSTGSNSSGIHGEGRPCTMIGTPVGIGIDIDPAIAPKVADASINVCWDGACKSPKLTLMDSTAVGSTQTNGDTSSATMVKTGGKHAFADIAGLPAKPVQVTLELTGTETVRFRSQTLEVTPKMLEANGPGCGESGPQTGVIVGPDGTARPR